MEFKTLFPILKKHLADGYDVPTFFRDLMAMITTVTEEEWGTSNDPSCKCNNDTIRGYTKRKIPKKLAQTVVYRLTPEILEERINEKNDTQRELLADDLRGFDPEINAANVGKKVAQWMVEIFQTTAGLVPQDELEQQKQEKMISDLKNRYGDYLLSETSGYCPNCGKELTVSENGKISNVYSVAIIDGSKNIEPKNLLAMCPHCCATYRLDSKNKKLCKELQSKKAVLVAHKQSAHLLDDLPLEKGITGVITRIQKLKETDLAEAALDPKELNKKIDPTKDLTLYLSVNLYVTTYFIKIRDIMMNLDKSKVIDYEEIQDQMKAIYRRLSKTNKTKLEIFTEITQKVHRVTLQEDIFCQIVVSYFIQSCEVF